MSSSLSLLAWAPWCFLAYVLILTTYRLFISPLARLPGPTLAALTYWYEFYYDFFLPGQYVFKIKEMHDRYGPVVRISPREVSISDPSFVDVIYAPGGAVRRNKDLHSVKALGTAEGLGASIAHDLHKSRREPLAPFFSRSTIFRVASSLVRQKGDELDAVLGESATNGTILNLSDVLFGLANDVVQEYSFGTNDNLLSDPTRASMLRNNIRSLLHTVHFAKHFTWVRDILALLPEKYAPPGVQDMMHFRRRIRSNIDRLKSHGPEEKSSIFSVLLASSTLPAAEKRPQRLEDEATLLVMAGTESPATALTIAIYHLLANPKLMSNLRQELRQNPSSTSEELDKLPYLNAILTEAYRLGFGLSGRHPQIDPDNPMHYTDSSTGKAYTFPAGTPVGVQTLVLHTNEDIFPEPWDFNPDRWLGPEGRARHKHLLSFNKGTRQCIGIHLAGAELRVGLATAARWDMELFETDIRDVAFLHDYFVATPRLDTKGVRVKVKGRAW